VAETESAFLRAAIGASEIAPLDTKLVASMYQIYSLTKQILNVEGNFSSIIGGDSGVAKETRYYFNIMTNTFHEAIARLIQLHLLLNPNDQQVNTTSISQIGNITYHPAGYTARGGTPLKLIWATIATSFMATH